MAGPSEWFTGAVYIDTVATPSEPSRLQRRQRPLHAGRPHRVAHPPQRPDDLRHRGHRPRASAAAGRSRSSVPATASSSSPARSTGTAPPQPLHDPPRDARGRRPGQRRHLGRARHRRGSTTLLRPHSRRRVARSASRGSAIDFEGRECLVPGRVVQDPKEQAVADRRERGLVATGSYAVTTGRIEVECERDRVVHRDHVTELHRERLPDLVEVAPELGSPRARGKPGRRRDRAPRSATRSRDPPSR